MSNQNFWVSLDDNQSFVADDDFTIDIEPLADKEATVQLNVSKQPVIQSCAKEDLAGTKPETKTLSKNTAIVASDMCLRGNVTITGKPLYVYGAINGQITSDDDVIVDGGNIRGQIHAKQVKLINGAVVTGSVFTESGLMMDGTSKLYSIQKNE